MHQKRSPFARKLRFEGIIKKCIVQIEGHFTFMVLIKEWHELGVCSSTLSGTAASLKAGKAAVSYRVGERICKLYGNFSFFSDV